MKKIKEALTPCMKELDDKEVNSLSVIMFFSTYVREMLKEIDDKNIKEAVLRNMLD